MNYLPDFRCVNRPIPVLVSSGNCNASCMPKSENVVKCCQEASRSAMVTTCGRPLWPLLRYLFSLCFFWFWWCRWHLPWIIYILYQLNDLLLNSVTSLLFAWIRCVCVCVWFLLPFLSISVWVKDSNSDWSIDQTIWERWGVKRAWQNWSLLFCGKHDVCAICSRDAYAEAASVICLSIIRNVVYPHTHTLHLSWRTHIFVCQPAARICESTSKQKEETWQDDERISTMRMDGSKTKSMRRKSRSCAMRKLLVVVVLVRHAKKQSEQQFIIIFIIVIIIARRAQIIKHKSPFKLRFCPAAAQIRFQIRFRIVVDWIMHCHVLSVPLTSWTCLVRHDDDQNLQMFSACSYKMPQSRRVEVFSFA